MIRASAAFEYNRDFHFLIRSVFLVSKGNLFYVYCEYNLLKCFFIFLTCPREDHGNHAHMD